MSTKPIFTKEELATEEWRSVHEHYEVSNLGRVRYVNILAGSYSGSPYQRISFASGQHGRSPQTKMVHTLVAQAFLGARPDGLVINHKDLNKWNNRVNNLEYVTQMENHLHARQNRDSWDTTHLDKNRRYGEEVNTAKLTADQVREIRRLYSEENVSNKELRRLYGISKGQVSKIVLRQNWKHI